MAQHTFTAAFRSAGGTTVEETADTCALAVGALGNASGVDGSPVADAALGSTLAAGGNATGGNADGAARSAGPLVLLQLLSAAAMKNNAGNDGAVCPRVRDLCVIRAAS
jgi:hypothetical protein